MRKLILCLCLILIFILPSVASGQIAAGGETQAHDITIQLVQTDLTHDGIQYDDPDTSSTADTYATVFEKSFDMGLSEHWATGVDFTQTMIDCYFKLIVSGRAVSTATADISWLAQARNKDGTWTSLADSCMFENPSTTFVDSTRKGYVEMSTTFNKVPFDFRIRMKCSEDDEGIIKLKSGSYIRAIYKEKL